MILKDDKCIIKLINITNICMNLGHWPNHFKILTMIIIPKPNKQAYDMPKSFWPIVLLNTLGKLFKKMIGERLQFHSISNNFVHVVATTRRNGTRSMLTSAKLSVGYLVVGITRELDKEPSLHCSFIYINYMWSMLQQY